MYQHLAKKYAGSVPRYTSYPTAPHFSNRITHDTYGSWLECLSTDDALSLYVHIPFCQSLCWYCGCSTKMVARYEPVAAYVETLLAEIRSVAERLGQRRRVSHIHWGGGSPNILTPRDIARLAMALGSCFDILPDAEHAVEIDPRYLDVVQTQAWIDAGVNRVSLGVQDFNPCVQSAINRQQPFEVTERAIKHFRDAGVKSVNIDLVYGLPKQSRESVEDTIDQVLTLSPDRIALFGYAHLPSRIKHQRLINSDDLPGAVERFAQSNRAAHKIVNAGYRRVGLDHFAKPDDSLALSSSKRNFQGYTSDEASVLIGLGATAIGRLPQGYVQNAVATGEYMRRIAESGLATARGFELSQDDNARAYVINRLMCDLDFSAEAVRSQFEGSADELIETAQTIVEMDADGLVEETEQGFQVTERGRPFVRSICSCFDAYLDQGQAQHASGV